MDVETEKRIRDLENRIVELEALARDLAALPVRSAVGGALGGANSIIYSEGSTFPASMPAAGKLHLFWNTDSGDDQLWAANSTSATFRAIMRFTSKNGVLGS